MIYVHLAEGFEEVEAMTVVDLLRRADIDVKTVSVSQGRLVRGTHGVNIEADIFFDEADYDICDMIVLPGGLPGADNLQQHEGLGKKIKEFAAGGKLLAAICAAPMIFGTYDLLDGKKATIYPGMEACLKNGEAVNAGVVKDGNIITGQGPALAVEFALAIIEEVKDRASADAVAAGLLYERK